MHVTFTKWAFKFVKTALNKKVKNFKIYEKYFHKHMSLKHNMFFA